MGKDGAELLEGADGELLGGVSGAFAFDDQEAVRLGGVLLLLRSRIKPSAKGERAVVLALDGSLWGPEVPTVKGGARRDAFAGEGLREVVRYEAFKGGTLGLLGIGLGSKGRRLDGPEAGAFFLDGTA